MFRRVLAICVVLGFASVVHAGAVLELQVTDMGSVDANGNHVGWAPLTADPGPDDQFMVHAYLTSDTTLTSGARLINLDATGPGTTFPYDWLGIDADAINQPIDGVPNFWFDYTSLFAGRFPAQGMVEQPGIPGVTFSSTGGYTDFSNTISGDPEGPGPVNTTWGTSTGTAQMIFFAAGEPVHVGAMVVTVPTDYTGNETFTLDLLNAEAPDINWGARIDFDFDSPTTWSAFGGEITYGTGAGPAEVATIPEPVTLLLLGLGGVAVLRRRR